MQDEVLPAGPPNPAEPLPARFTARHSRRFLLVTGILLAVTAVVNLILFRKVGLDAFFGLTLAMIVMCFLYQKFWPTMRILNWFFIALTLPFWALGLLLYYHMILATWARITVEPVPPQYQPVPTDPQQVAAYHEFKKRFPDHPSIQRQDGSAIKFHEFARSEFPRNQPSRPLNELVLDPAFRAELASVEPYVDDVLSFVIEHRPHLGKRESNRELNRFMSLAPVLDIQRFRIVAATIDGDTEKRRGLVSRFGEAIEALLSVELSSSQYTIYSLSVPMLVSRLEKDLPEYSYEIEQQLIEVIRAHGKAALASLFRLPAHEARDFAAYYQSDESEEYVIGFGDLITTWGFGTEWEEPTEHLDTWLIGRMERRLYFWPFLDSDLTLNYMVHLFEGAAEGDPTAKSDLVREADAEVAWELSDLLKVNPGGRIVCRPYMYVHGHSISTHVRNHRKLKAYTVALAWRARLDDPKLQLENINSGSHQYHTQVTLEPDGTERLVILGGKPEPGRKAPKDETYLYENGLEDKYTFAIIMTRPTQETAVPPK